MFVIDNEQAILDGMQALEAQWSCEFQLFLSVVQAEAFQRENSAPPNVIICDYRLADDITGSDAIKRLRTLYDSDIPAILISGDADSALVSEARLNDFYLLHKPIQANKLRAIVGIAANDS